MEQPKHPWVSREEYLHHISQHAVFQLNTERIRAKDASGRTTAVAIRSKHTLPNSPSSTMDGIAIKSSAIDGKTIPDTSGWELGKEYVFSNTGVGIAPGFDTVVLIEDVAFDDTGGVRILTPPVPGRNIKKVGAAMKTGDLLVPANHPLGAAQLGLITAGGVEHVDVLARPKVAILPTGNELVPVDRPLPLGKTVEFNGILIEAKVRQMGAETRLYPITRDEPEALKATISDALAWADLVILNGGTSKGSDDRAIEVLASLGKVLVHEVDYGPGKHTTLTLARGKLIIGTVGPTIGAEYAVEWYVSAALGGYFGHSVRQSLDIPVRLLEEISGPAGFDFYARVNISKEEDGYVAAASGGRTAPLASQLSANGILRIPRGVAKYQAGDLVMAELRKPASIHLQKETASCLFGKSF